MNDDDPINYFKFNLSAARKVGVRILRLDFNADLYIEDNSGTVIHSSENAGDNKEVLNIQLAATGEVYYIRVEGKEAGENDYTLRYLTEEIPVPEPVPEPALQSQSQQSTTTRGVGDATGKPTISGPPQVGETLEADTSAIDDTDGINNVAFTYQWIRVDSSDVETNITTAVASTYLVTADDLDNTIKVKVSFTDDAGNSEALTSDAYPAVGTVAAAKTECPTDHDWCTTMTSGRIVTPLATGSFAQFGYISPSFGVLDDDAPSDPHRDTDYTVTKIFIAKNSDSGGTVVAHSLSFFVSDGTLPDGTALNLNGTEFSVGTDTETSAEGQEIWDLRGSPLSGWVKDQFVPVCLTFPSEAALTDLTLSDATLKPTFTAVTTTYTASAENSVTQTTVTATPLDSDAGIEFLDGFHTALTDVDELVDGFQVDLAVGDTVIKAKVTTDENVTETYQVTVARSAALTFVSNIERPNFAIAAASTSSTRRSQQFTTGSHAGGYRLTQVVVNFKGTSTGTHAFAIYTSTTSDTPGTEVVALTGNNPTTGQRTFKPASETILSPSTKYLVYLATSSGSVNLQATSSNSVDDGAASGWDIAGESVEHDGSTWTTDDNSLEIATIGANTASSDATLSALTLSDATLNENVAATTTTYTADVANSVTQTTVTATPADSNADVVYLDGSDTALTDADTLATEFQVDLAVGDTVIRAHVTAEDNNTTETYQVTVTRAAGTQGTVPTNTFVSNIGQADIATASSSTQTNFRAQRFTTGSNSGGYRLTEVVVNIRTGDTGGAALAVDTSNDSDHPGTKVQDLRGTIASAGEQIFVPIYPTTLSASTDYIVVFTTTSGTGDVQGTESDNVDSGADPGSDIADDSLLSTNSGTSWATATHAAKIAIKGNKITASTVTEVPKSRSPEGLVPDTGRPVRRRPVPLAGCHLGHYQPILT